MTAFQVEGRTHVKVEKGTTEKRPSSKDCWSTEVKVKGGWERIRQRLKRKTRPGSWRPFVPRQGIESLSSRHWRAIYRLSVEEWQGQGHSSTERTVEGCRTYTGGDGNHIWETAVAGRERESVPGANTCKGPAQSPQTGRAWQFHTLQGSVATWLVFTRDVDTRDQVV